MTSSATSVNSALADYLAGRMTADNVVATVAAAYYREQEARSREQLRPIIEIIERAHPGVVELSATEAKPGFAIALKERPFPKRYERELRTAVESLVTAPSSPLAAPAAVQKKPGLLRRIFAAIRKVFSA